MKMVTETIKVLAPLAVMFIGTISAFSGQWDRGAFFMVLACAIVLMGEGV
jgi:hypothetical protein